jgi:hypothetical protein
MSMNGRGARWWRGGTAVLVVWLAGCGESVEHLPSGVGPAGTPGTPPTDHTGQLLLLDQYKLPYANMPVLVDDTLVTTDADGYATMPAVGDQYDVSVVAGDLAYVFHGLSTRSPVVRLVVSGTGAGVSSMSLAMASPPLRDDQTLVYSAGFANIAEDQQFFGTSIDAEGLSLEGHWAGSSPVTFSAEAFVVDVDPSTGGPLAFTGYASRSWKVTPGAELSWTPSPTAPPFATAAIQVSVSLPAGAQVTSYDVWAREASGRQSHLGPIVSFAYTDEKVLVPDLPGAVFDVIAGTGDGTSVFEAEADGLHAGDQVTLEAHSGPVPLSPEDGADVSLDTDFTWTEDEGAVYRLFLTAHDGDKTRTYVIVTTEPTTRLPDLTALGAPFPSGQELSWQIFSLPGVAPLDHFAADGHYGSTGYSMPRTATATP